jgi:hypothetical protein
MRLATRPRVVAGWVHGIAEDAEPGTLAPGTLAEGENFVPTPAGRLRTRGGSRIVQSLTDDNAGDPVDHVCALAPFTNVGALAIGWSDTEDKHYAWRLTVDMDFATGSEGTSRHDLTASPSTSWDNTSDPARPVMAEVFEKLYVADATADYSDRNEMLAIDSAGTVTRRTFVFGAGAAGAPLPYCVEEYNGVLFMAGYGTEDSGDGDRPEYLRHSFLGRSPDAADGFDIDAWAIIGAKGQRVSALRKGGPYLLVAKSDDLYRVSGFGRAYAGWQYQITRVTNTKGLGITNPNALTFAEGYWWGISAQGPIRTDGFNVELLVGARLRSWMSIDQTEFAWVSYHPQRRLMLFGLHPVEAAAGRSDTYPWTVWAWDLTRDVWQPEHRYGADLFFASPVTPVSLGSGGGGGGGSGPTAPAAPPSVPVTSLETTTGYTASWTNGDVTCQTEYWEKKGAGGTWALVTVLAAAVATLARTGRDNHESYYWRVRHRKGGVTSSYTAETIAQTLIAAPGCSAAQDGGGPLVEVTVAQNAPGTSISIERQVDGGGYLVWKTTGSSGSVYDTNRACGQVLNYRARSIDAAWPNPNSSYSSVSTVDLTSGCSEEI